MSLTPGGARPPRDLEIGRNRVAEHAATETFQPIRDRMVGITEQMVSRRVMGHGDLIRLADHNGICVRLPAGFQLLSETVRKRTFHPQAGRAASSGSVEENGFIQRIGKLSS
jgi:hypothetical protein